MSLYKLNGNLIEVNNVLVGDFWNGMASYWRLNETSGTAADDSLGAVNGTLTTGAFNASGKSGYCYKRTSKNGEGINVGNNYAFEYNQAFSFNLWIKFDALNTFSLFLSKENSTNYYGYGLFRNSSNQIYCEIRGTTFIQNKNTGTTITSTSDWYMVTLTYNGSGANTGAIVYVNANGGGQYRNGSISSTMVTTQPLTFGSYAADLTNGHLGSMDEISVWTKALSQAEVTQLYNAGAGLFY